MKKNWLFILAIIIFVLSLFGTYYYYSKPKIVSPVATGGDKLQEVPPDYERELLAMEQLSKSLPINTPYFSIEFNFKKGKYVVNKISSTNLQRDFDNWYKNSQFQEIPKTRFLIKD